MAKPDMEQAGAAQVLCWGYRTQSWIERRCIKGRENSIQKWEGAGRVRPWIADLTGNKLERHGRDKVATDLCNGHQDGDDNQGAITFEITIEKLE